MERWDYLAAVLTLLNRFGITGGLRAAIAVFYDREIRRDLPRTGGRTIARFNGVEVPRDRRLLDGWIPGAGNRPDYEHALCGAIRRAVSRGDDVVIVGGGEGVSTVVAARAAGPAGTVRVYEGAIGYVDTCRATVRHNDLGGRVTVHHAVVEWADRLYGDRAGADRVAAADLPDCDVLVLDCEGAEGAIIEAMSIRPVSIVVETHGCYGTPTDETWDRLLGRGYRIRERDPAHTLPAKRDQYVLRAEREDARSAGQPDAVVAAGPPVP